MPLPVTPEDLPIREDDADVHRHRQALMLAQAHGLLRFLSPFDLSDPMQVEALQFELGPDAQLPLDDRVYDLVYVEPEGGGVWPVPVLVPEEDANGFALALAIRRDPQLAARFLYRVGLVPLEPAV